MERTLYDYLQLILPTVSGLLIASLGWFFAVVQNNRNFRSQLQKEQYYKSKEAIARISTLSSDYLNFVYQFTKITKNSFNQGKRLDGDVLNDFITESQMKLAFIHQLIRIEFPGFDTRSASIAEQTHIIESVCVDLDTILVGLQTNRYPNLEKINKDIVELHAKTRQASEKITDLLNENEVEIVKQLHRNALQLKIARSDDQKL